MRKNFGKKTWFYPLPVLIIGTYDANGTPNAMNAAWGVIHDYGQVEINLAEHRTTENMRITGAFTVAFADAKHVVEADYVGIVSGNEVPDKVEIAGLHTEKSKFVDAPIITEFPMSLECRVLEITDEMKVIGEIVNVSADESVLDDNGEIDTEKLHIITFDPVHNTYVELGKKVGSAFKDGLKLKN